MFLFLLFFSFFFNDTATTEIYTLSLHDALPTLPSRSQSVGPIPKPLSKIEACRLDMPVARNGEHSSPGSAGSLRRLTRTSVSGSPMRVPPPGRLKTVRPSCASSATELQYR